MLAEVVEVFQRHLCPVWIKVPTSADEKRKIALAFYLKHKIPGVVGCIDGTHVQVIAPTNNKHLFYNRKGRFSLNVMLVSFLIKTHLISYSHNISLEEMFYKKLF